AFTALTASAHSVAGFAAIQFVARTFLVAELAIAITMATEEFPADRRGRIVGTLSALGAVGLITVAVAYRLLAHTALGWRGASLPTPPTRSSPPRSCSGFPATSSPAACRTGGDGGGRGPSSCSPGWRAAWRRSRPTGGRRCSPPSRVPSSSGWGGPRS